MNWRRLCGTAAAAAAFSASPAQAMNWCALLDLAPTSENDFERVAARIESATGCPREATDSVHLAQWRCEGGPDDGTESLVSINLQRTPGTGIALYVLTFDFTDFSRFRNCPGGPFRVSETFVPGDVLKRGTLAPRGIGPQFTLLSRGGEELSIFYSTVNGYSDPFGNVYRRTLGGYEAKSYVQTSVRIAGKNLLSTPAPEMIEAMTARGAQVTGTEQRGLLDKWTLSSMVGLGGVSSIVVSAYQRHITTVEYLLESVDDYRSFMALLDQQYGRSTPVNDKGCTYRTWTSGDALIVGEVCNGRARISFNNRVALDQGAAVAKQMRGSGTASKSPPRPSVDRDNY